MIDILNIQPSVISRDLRGKYILIYGKPKSGKTTAACSFPKPLLVAFERGYNAIGGVRPVDIQSWSDYKIVINQLSTEEAHQQYETIVIDTISIAWQLCENYICARSGVKKINDIPWGQGYAECTKEFEATLRQITMMGYGLTLIAHSTSRVEKTANGDEIEVILPEMPKRASEICNGLVDIIGYIGGEYDENKNYVRYLYTRPTPTLFAGSRFKYLQPKIKFGYKELVDAISEAIDKSERLDGVKVVDDASKENHNNDQLDFGTLRNEAQELWEQLIKIDEHNANTIMRKIEAIMGHRMKLSEFTEDQVELLQLAVMEMRDMV